MSGFYPKNAALGQVIQSEVSDDNPDRAFLAHIEWTAAEAVAIATAGVHAFIADSADGNPTVVTTNITNPGVPRNITASVDDDTGDDADIKAVQVIIVGTNILDEVITETLPIFTVNTAGTVSGAKAFKTVTSITSPAHDSPYDAKVSIGWGDILGLPYERDEIPLIDAFLNSVLEGTAATMTYSATAIESNTIDLNSALNGTKVDAYIVI